MGVAEWTREALERIPKIEFAKWKSSVRTAYYIALKTLIAKSLGVSGNAISIEIEVSAGSQDFSATEQWKALATNTPILEVLQHLHKRTQPDDGPLFGLPEIKSQTADDVRSAAATYLGVHPGSKKSRYANLTAILVKLYKLLNPALREAIVELQTGVARVSGPLRVRAKAAQLRSQMNQGAFKQIATSLRGLLTVPDGQNYTTYHNIFMSLIPLASPPVPYTKSRRIPPLILNALDDSEIPRVIPNDLDRWRTVARNATLLLPEDRSPTVVIIQRLLLTQLLQEFELEAPTDRPPPVSAFKKKPSTLQSRQTDIELEELKAQSPARKALASRGGSRNTVATMFESDEDYQRFARVLLLSKKLRPLMHKRLDELLGLVNSSKVTTFGHLKEELKQLINKYAADQLDAWFAVRQEIDKYGSVTTEATGGGAPSGKRLAIRRAPLRL